MNAQCIDAQPDIDQEREADAGQSPDLIDIRDLPEAQQGQQGSCDQGDHGQPDPQRTGGEAAPHPIEQALIRIEDVAVHKEQAPVHGVAPVLIAGEEAIDESGDQSHDQAGQPHDRTGEPLHSIECAEKPPAFLRSQIREQRHGDHGIDKQEDQKPQVKPVATRPLQVEARESRETEELREIAEERAAVPAVIHGLIIRLQRRQDQRQHDVRNDQAEEALAHELLIRAPSHGEHRRRARDDEQQRHTELIADDGDHIRDRQDTAADDQPVRARKGHDDVRDKHAADDEDAQPIEIIQPFFRLWRCSSSRHTYSLSVIH